MNRFAHGLFPLLFCGGLALGFPTPARSDPNPFLQPAESGSSGAASRTQRFVFRDFARADATMLAARVEEVAAAVETRVGRALPFRRFEIIRISAADGTDGSIYVGQGFADSLMQQRIVVERPELVSEEAFREAIVKTLLERYVLALSSPKSDGAAPMRVPDWLAVGMAHSTDAEVRRRDAEFVIAQWRTGESRSVAACLQLVRLPFGASDGKPFCGMLFTWLSRELRGPATWYSVLGRIAKDDEIDIAWFTDEIFGLPGARDVEKKWDLWLARQTLLHRELGAVQPDRIRRVRELLDIRLVDYGFSASPGMPDRLTVYDLVDRRDEAWAQRIAHQLAGELQAVAVGQAPEFAGVVDSFCEVLLAVAPGGRRGVSTASLRRDLREDEADLARLERDLTLRSEYIEGVERIATEPSATHVAPPSASSIEEERRRFLERIQSDRPALSTPGQPP